jgi:hypothetical protein
MQRRDNDAIQKARKEMEWEAERDRLIGAIAGALTYDPEDKIGFITDKVVEILKDKLYEQEYREEETRRILKAAKELEEAERVGGRK